MIQIQAVLRDKGSLADGTRRIQLDCQEAPAEQLVEILRANGSIGWFVFKEKIIEEKDIPEANPEFDNEKSPSQRLRNILYVYWEQNTGKKIAFDVFWKQWIERAITQIKEKLT